MTNDITILSCPICNNPKLREYGNGIYRCDVCETYFDKDENVVLTEQEWLQTCTTEQLAEWIASVVKKAISIKENNDIVMLESAIWWDEWLKQPHTPKE